MLDTSHDIRTEIADTLETDDRFHLIILVVFIGIGCDMRRQCHQIVVGCVRHPVETAFPAVDLVGLLLVRIAQQTDRFRVVLQCHLAHMGDQMMRLLQRQSRVVEQSFIQLAHHFLILHLFCIFFAVFDDLFGDRCQTVGERQEDESRNDTEKTVHIGYAARIQHSVPDTVAKDTGGAQDHKTCYQQDQSQNVIDHMDQDSADLIFGGADAADKICRQAVADIDAEDDREGTAELHADRTGQRLQDTDNSRRTLDDGRCADTCQKSKEIIVFERQ